MQYTERDRVIALAGLFQAVKLVQQVARSGMLDNATLSTCLQSIFNIDAASVETVYGNVSALSVGRNVLRSQLGDMDAGKPRDIELTKYAISIMVLERKLAKQPAMLEKIAKGIERSRTQLTHFPLTHENIIASLAGIYSDTVSTLRPKIMVNGEHMHLANPDNANKIRALLLAAIRAAVLWRQCGGNRWQLLFKRNAILESARNLLDNVTPRTLH